MKKLVIAISILGLMTQACTQKRDAAFRSGQGEDLLVVSQIDGKTFEIQTNSTISGSSQNITKSKELMNNSKELGAQNFEAVKYEILGNELAKKLIGSTMIIGKPHFKYEGLIKITENYLKLYKVGNIEDIPAQERTYAETIPNSKKIAIALIGYPITSKSTVVKEKNAYNEDTTVLTEKAQTSIKSATHFKIDFNRGRVFESVTKSDLLPASFFNGEWYYSETIIAAPESSQENIGMGGAYDQNLEPSTRIKFLTTENSLSGVNLNVDNRIKNSDELNLKTAFTIPMSWKSYKTVQNGNDLELSETEDNSTHWSTRKYVQLDFGSTKTAMTSGSAKLVGLEINDNYLSFTILKQNESQSSTENVRIKYSFLKVSPTKYQKRQSFEEDRKIFGFFTTEKSSIYNYEIRRKSDIEKNIFINRFNPAKGVIEFHFTKSTPQWIRPAVQQAVNAWDKTFFEDAKTNIHIVLNTQFDVELGDLRYNAINIIESYSASNLFGFGPTVTDPYSGEIISATTNVHLTPIRSALVDEISNYIKYKQGYMDLSKVPGMSFLINQIDQILTENSKTGEKSISQNYLKALAENSNFKMFLPEKNNVNKMKLQKIDFSKSNKNFGREFDLSVSSSNIHKEIETQCPEVVQYIEKNKNKVDSDAELVVLNSCSTKLVVGKFQGTLIHEMGHNFGLRHNFMGSNDSQNFSFSDGKKIRSSSVMEYPSFNEDRLTNPGNYDLAAIRFGYADSVVDKNDKVVKLISTSSPIDKTVQLSDLKKYKFCTDEDVELGTDPMCQRHDAGETPLEVVRNIIADYNSSLQTLNYKYDNINGANPSRLTAYRFDKFFIPLKHFYETYRIELSRRIGKDNVYLENFNKEQLNAEIERLTKNNTEFADFINLYRPAADASYQFLIQLVFLSDRYCVGYDTNTNAVRTIELETIRDQAIFKFKKLVKTCSDEAALDILKNDLQVQFIFETGHDYNSVKYENSNVSLLQAPDIVGTSGDRMNALLVLTQRFPISIEAMQKGFLTSFMDEPSYRNATLELFQNRFLYGINGNSILTTLVEKLKSSSVDQKIIGNIILKNTQVVKNSEGKPQRIATPIEKFITEKDILSEGINLLINSLNIPEKHSDSISRTVDFGGFVARPGSAEAKAAVVSVDIGGGVYVVPDDKALFSIRVVERYKYISAARAAKEISATTYKNEILILEKELLAEDELSKLSIKDIFNKIQKIIESYNQMSEPAQAALASLVLPFQELGQGIVEAQKSMDPEKAQKFEEANFIKTVGDSDLRIKMFLKSNLSATIENNNLLVQTYKLNKSDLDAQMNILINYMKEEH